jgi:hypothetical protein
MSEMRARNLPGSEIMENVPNYSDGLPVRFAIPRMGIHETLESYQRRLIDWDSAQAKEESVARAIYAVSPLQELKPGVTAAEMRRASAYKDVPWEEADERTQAQYRHQARAAMRTMLQIVDVVTPKEPISREALLELLRAGFAVEESPTVFVDSPGPMARLFRYLGHLFLAAAGDER